MEISFNNQVSILGKTKLGETTMLQSSFVIFTQACIFCTVKSSMITNCRKLLKRALFTDCRRALSSCIYNVSQEKWLHTRAGGRYENLGGEGGGGIINTSSFDGTGFVSNSSKIWRGNCQLIPPPPSGSTGPAYFSAGV